MRHPNKVILITGCSSGFGLLTAVELSAKNHTVIATMRDLFKQHDLKKAVRSRGGNLNDIYQLDVTDLDSIRKTIEIVLLKYGRIDVLVNNAGFGLGGFFEDLTQSQIREQLETNFFGVQNVTREVLPTMRKQGSGKIINISSIAGLTASPAFGAYNSSKWALEGFSESLWYELKPFGIDVCLIEPGTYKTKIFYENAKYAEKFDEQESPYYEQSQFLKQRVLKFVTKTKKDPKKIAYLIQRLIEKENPPLRNVCDWESRLMLFFRRFLPFSIYSYLIRSIWKKD